MEKNARLISQDKKNVSKIIGPHEINIKDRKTVKMTGVIEVLSATATAINTKTEYGALSITGHDLRVNLLDIESKVVEVVGDINDIKYHSSKKSFLQRLFK